jgi:hypothetical protein
MKAIRIIAVSMLAIGSGMALQGRFPHPGRQSADTFV